MGIDDKAWRALESLARELNEKSPEAVARKAIGRAKGVGVRVLDGLVSRLAGRRVDTAPRRMIEPGAPSSDGAWVARAIAGTPSQPTRPASAPPVGWSDDSAPSAVRAPDWSGEGEPPPPRLERAAEVVREDPPVIDLDPAPAPVEAVTERTWSGEGPAPTLGVPESSQDLASSNDLAPGSPRDPLTSSFLDPTPPADPPASDLLAPASPAEGAPTDLLDPTSPADLATSTSLDPPPPEDPAASAPPAPTSPAPPAPAEDLAAEAPRPLPTDAPPDLVVPSATAPLPALPPRYGLDRVVLLAGESEWVFVYGETDPARTGGAARAELRLLSEEGALVGRAYVDPVQGRQHLRVPARGRRYHAELVHLDGTVLSRSRDVVVRAPESP